MNMYLNLFIQHWGWKIYFVPTRSDSLETDNEDVEVDHDIYFFETSHPYKQGREVFEKCELAGADKIAIHFSPQCSTVAQVQLHDIHLFTIEYMIL